MEVRVKNFNSEHPYIKYPVWKYWPPIYEYKESSWAEDGATKDVQWEMRRLLEEYEEISLRDTLRKVFCWDDINKTVEGAPCPERDCW